MRSPSYPGLLLYTALAAGCSPMAPLDIDPDKAAYAVMGADGAPSMLCFDTISPNNCVVQPRSDIEKKLSHRERMLLQKYIWLLARPTQIDCKVFAPNQCRIYFEHIHVDITIDPDEFTPLRKQLEGTGADM